MSALPSSLDQRMQRLFDIFEMSALDRRDRHLATLQAGKPVDPQPQGTEAVAEGRASAAS